MFAPVRSAAKLSDQVAEVLIREITEGNLKAGDKLPSEPHLVEQFAVSRTVLREAISRLKSLGLVESRQGSGVFVLAADTMPLRFDPEVVASREAVVQIAEVRRALEAEVAALAAARRVPADIARLEQAFAAIDAAVAAGHDGVDEDVAFHRAIADTARNPFLISTLQYMRQFLHGATRVTRANEARRHDFATAVRSEHEAILLGIAAGEPARARDAASRHMNNAILRIEAADPSFWSQQGAALAAPLKAGPPAGG
ncbi:FadR/GntR family transcriptional regulator [Derxia lacustris]|uniref:FadR/GntR family transcriptional regulator n=1 Tax=Derxia lacustris TaxID=764842 RepID=UPI000A177BE1|nr:FadR/GntR family transcriptional regulator [Derxia lacustris]